MAWQPLAAANMMAVDRLAKVFIASGKPAGNGCDRLAEAVHWETMHGPVCAGPAIKALGAMDWDMDGYDDA